MCSAGAALPALRLARCFGCCAPGNPDPVAPSGMADALARSSHGRDARRFRLTCPSLIDAWQYPSWGEDRIANELLLKLGLRVSPRTVRKYIPKRSPGCPVMQRWSRRPIPHHPGSLPATRNAVGVSYACENCSISTIDWMRAFTRMGLVR